MSNMKTEQLTGSELDHAQGGYLKIGDIKGEIKRDPRVPIQEEDSSLLSMQSDQMQY